MFISSVLLHNDITFGLLVALNVALNHFLHVFVFGHSILWRVADDIFQEKGEKWFAKCQDSVLCCH